MKRNKLIAFLTIIIFVAMFFCNIAYADETNIEIGSPSAILIEADTGRIFYEKNPDEKMYPASTTKVMTALLVLENIQDLQEKATVSYKAVFTVPVGYSLDTLKVGEELTIEDLLYALLVKSSNEAANVLAEHISGSVESFATMMNAKATELGCTNTNFVNPNGIHNENHYTTARDLSIITKEAMKNPTFRKIVSTVSYTLPSTNKYEKTDRILFTTNDLINKKNKNYYEYAIGIKTGYTTPAKNCLVAGANKNKIELIAVILGASKKDENGYSIRDNDAKKLFNHIYDNYSKNMVAKANETIIQNIKVKGATRDTKNLPLTVDKDIGIIVTNDKANEKIEGTVELNKEIKAPIAKGTTLGTITYNYGDIEYKANLIAVNDVKKSNIILNILRGLLAILILFIIYITVARINRKKRKKIKYMYK